MRKILKIVGYGAAGIGLLVVVGAAAVYLLSNRKLQHTYQVKVSPPVVPTGAAAVSRGRHIAETRGCTACHGPDLAGAKVVDDPAMGRLFGPNLTRGRGGLPAGVTDEELVRAIRHGVARDGHGLFLMPSEDFARFTDQDMGDLIAYVRSVPAVDRASVPLAVGPVARLLLLAGKIRLAADVIDHARLRPDTVQPGTTLTYGRYLAAGCTGCHGPNFSGGKIDIGPPDWPPARNLTPAGDLAHWTREDFFRALRGHTRPDGTRLSEVMPAAFGQMDDTELEALWIYLQSLPPAATASR